MKIIQDLSDVLVKKCLSYIGYLGNVRVSYSRSSTGSAEVLEENNYYPFGLKHQGYTFLIGNPAYNYQYNGKELQKETGWNDYGEDLPFLKTYLFGSLPSFSDKLKLLNLVC